jgi:hypothetical protein
MKDTIRVFVNAQPLDLPSKVDVAHAVRLLDPALERQIASGGAYVTDARGIEIDLTSPLVGGAILRVVVRARRSDSGHADA